jgi:hypothetical protein
MKLELNFTLAHVNSTTSNQGLTHRKMIHAKKTQLKYIKSKLLAEFSRGWHTYHSHTVDNNAKSNVHKISLRQ